MMKNNKKLYLILLIASIISMVLCFLFDANGVFAYILFIFSLYIFLGSIIKLCMISEKLKNNVINFIDILFWIP